jgi:drug/metabolite transporter (DMT)-like permease
MTGTSQLPARARERGAHARPRTGSPHRKQAVLLVVATMCWGCDAAVAKFALRGFGPLTLLAIQLLVATTLLWAVLLIRCHRNGNYALATPRRVYALLGLLDPGLLYGGFNFGLVWTSAVAGSLLGGLEGSCTFALALLMPAPGRSFARRGLVAAAVSGTGAALVGLSSTTVRVGLGDALVLASVLAAAAGTLVASRQPADTDAMRMTVWQFTFGLLLTLPLLAWRWASGGEAVPAGAGPRQWLAAILGGIVVLAVPYLLFNVVVTKVPATTSAMMLNLYPLFGAAAAVLALGEPLTALEIAGGVLIVTGVGAFSHDPPS